jgi:hypothetical protein
VSFYATITGSARFRTKEAIDVALTRLRQHGWMNERNQFVSEWHGPLDPSPAAATVEGLTLHIPWHQYRNSPGDLDEILTGSRYKVVWTTTYGMYSAWVLIDGKEKEYDLEHWAAEHVGPRPDEDEDDSDYWDEVQSEFISWAMSEWDFDTLSADGD